MKRIAVALALFLLLSLSPQFVYSQEIQVPIDKDNKLYIIDADMESKLQLFTEYPHFIDARLYQNPDGNFVLEITYKVDERTMHQRKNMSASEVADLRNKVTQCILEKCPVVLINHEGRSSFLWGTTLLGLCAWDWMVPEMLEINGSSSYMALYLATASMSFFVPFLLTENAEVTDGEASLGIFGGVMGIFHGIMFNYLFKDNFTSGTFALMFCTSIAELTGGYYLAKSTNMTEGKANVISTIMTFGTGYGFGLPFVCNAKDEKIYMAGGLLGGGLGYFVGNYLSNSQNYTVGDASVLSNCGLLGAYFPMMINVLTDTKSGDIVVGSVLLGTTAGLYIGDRLVVGKDFTKSQGTFISIGTLAGGLLGGALGYAIEGNNMSSNGKMITMLSAFGALGGFTIMYEFFKDKAKVPDSRTSLEFEFNPGSYAASQLFKNSKSFYQPYVPMVGVRYRF